MSAEDILGKWNEEFSAKDWEERALAAMEEYASETKKALSDAMEECERLASIAEYWQAKYYEVVPPFHKPNIDNL